MENNQLILFVLIIFNYLKICPVGKSNPGSQTLIVNILLFKMRTVLFSIQESKNKKNIHQSILFFILKRYKKVFRSHIEEI